jgi:hypothetical protein
MENLKARARHLWNNFRLTIEQWTTVFRYQGEVCAVCGRPNKNGKRLSTDHDHKTGLFRGLLCQQCNRVLGKIEDPRWQMTPVILRRLADYWADPPATKALGKAHFGFKGRVGTKEHRKLLRRLAKAALKVKAKTRDWTLLKWAIRWRKKSA